MTLVVWKFEIPPQGLITMPAGARILSAGFAEQVPVVWALCNPHLEREQRYVTAVNTGADVPRNAREFIGTIIATRGTVWHVFAEHR